MIEKNVMKIDAAACANLLSLFFLLTIACSFIKNILILLWNFSMTGEREIRDGG